MHRLAGTLAHMHAPSGLARMHRAQDQSCGPRDFAGLGGCPPGPSMSPSLARRWGGRGWQGGNCSVQPRHRKPCRPPRLLTRPISSTQLEDPVPPRAVPASIHRTAFRDHYHTLCRPPGLPAHPPAPLNTGGSGRRRVQPSASPGAVSSRITRAHRPPPAAPPPPLPPWAPRAVQGCARRPTR